MHDPDHRPLSQSHFQASDEVPAVNRSGRRVSYVCSFAILALGFTNLGTVPLLVALVLLMLAPVFYGFKTWLQMQGPEADTPT